MAIDPSKERIILVVHGVQTQDDQSLVQHEVVERALRNRLNGLDLKFSCQLYAYENLNDQALSKLQMVVSAITNGILVGRLAQSAIDLVGDVMINLSNGSTAKSIREGLKEKILEIYQAGHPLYVLGHSLGSIYAFDAINELILNRNGIFDQGSRLHWPVQAFLSIGSPIGIDLFNQRKIQFLPAGEAPFRWVNIWDKTDPVTSAHFFGRADEEYKRANLLNKEGSGWAITDIPLDSGKQHLLAHTAYWENSQVIDDLYDLVTN